MWLFEEFPDIKNDFIALLNYSIDDITPEESELSVFTKNNEQSTDTDLGKKLLNIQAGKEQFQEYEKVCTEILKYVLGDYLQLWERQEVSTVMKGKNNSHK